VRLSQVLRSIIEHGSRQNNQQSRMCAAAGLGLAGDIAYNPNNGNFCVGGGLGVSEGHNLSFGPLVQGTSFTQTPFPENVDDILAGWSLSAGYNAGWRGGWQGMANFSGTAGGPTYGIPGTSGALYPKFLCVAEMVRKSISHVFCAKQRTQKLIGGSSGTGIIDALTLRKGR